jgi:hypothetical protein
MADLDTAEPLRRAELGGVPADRPGVGCVQRTFLGMEIPGRDVNGRADLRDRAFGDLRGVTFSPAADETIFICDASDHCVKQFHRTTGEKVTVYGAGLGGLGCF